MRLACKTQPAGCGYVPLYGTGHLNALAASPRTYVEPGDVPFQASIDIDDA